MGPTRGDENDAILPYEFGHFEGFFVLNDGDGKRLKNQLFNAFSGQLGLSRVNLCLAIAIRSIYPPVRGPSKHPISPYTIFAAYHQCSPDLHTVAGQTLYLFGSSTHGGLPFFGPIRFRSLCGSNDSKSTSILWFSL